MSKGSLLFFADRPELCDDLIGMIYKLKDVLIIRIKNFSVDQIRIFLVNHQNCILLFLIENSKDSAMSLLYKLNNGNFSLPYVIVIFKNSTQRLINHVKAHASFKIFCMQSETYSNEKVVDWIKKVSNCLNLSIIFPRLKSYMMSSAKYRIISYLKKIGMFAYLTGYKYIVDAIELYINNSNLYITKDIYILLANRYKTNAMNIDRCMRHAIETVWRSTDEEILNKYYYKNSEKSDGKPSVFDFIRCCASRIVSKNNF